MAQTPSQDFTNQAQADYQTITNYVNAQFSKSMGFITTLGWNTPPGVFDIMSGPRVEVGIGGGADLMGLADLKNLSLGAVDLNSNFSLPSVVPFPFPAITGRVGLMNGLDLGLKFLYLPQINLSDIGFNANYFGWGLDLRYKILDGLYVPTVTVGVSLDSMQGNIGLQTSINQSTRYTDPNTLQTYNATVNGTNNYTLNWDTKSFGAQVQFGKDLNVLYPFAAVGFQRNSGHITSTMKGNGFYTLSGGLGGGSGNINLLSVNDAPPVYFEPKFMVGLDFGAGLHWAIVGESNGTDIAGSTSFRAQF
ncbi:MAG TPA: DUF6588 family protein [bacterium]|nr:DUF6588 family protein [bacterium]